MTISETRVVSAGDRQTVFLGAWIMEMALALLKKSNQTKSEPNGSLTHSLARSYSYS